MLDQLWRLVEQTILLLGYPGIVLIVAIEVIVPPIPSEVVLPMAGALAATGSLSLVGVIAAATLGSVTGATALYALARWGREAVVMRLVRRYGALLSISEADLDTADRFFRRWGYLAVTVGRLVPIVRSLISLPAGHARLPMGVFVLLTALGSLLWNTVLVGGGYILGASWPLVGTIVQRYERITLALLVLLFAAGVVVLVVRARRRTASPPWAVRPDLPAGPAG